MNEQEPLYKIIQSIATTLSLIIIPIVVGFMANNYQAEMSRQKLNSEYITLAINILKDEPNKNNQELRRWAVQVIDYYSEIKLSQPVKDNLVKNSGLYVAPNGDLMYYKQKTKDFLGIPYGLGSDR